MRGTRSRLPVSWSVGGDHPRVCGEHCKLFQRAWFPLGSSPRMRGTPFSGSLLIARLGIIPAYAGNTWNRCFGITSVWDHPRVCGEHSKNMLDECEERGSSPRMRGTPLVVPVRGLPRGIIPAYAGNTHAWTSLATNSRDHPRVCGEHDTLERHGGFRPGSSPRMRGTLRPVASCTPSARIIPAYAGNTSNCSLNPATNWDHPRVCGEHELQSLNTAQQSGSSPRMRGTLANDQRAE